jgi:glucokinase
VVIGGNIAKACDWFLQRVEQDLQEQGLTIPLRIARLGENAHIMGAAGCWIEHI